MSVSVEHKLVEKVNSKLKKGEAIHMKLPGEGILNIDAPVPFLLVYRYPPDGKDYFSSHLGMTESSYIMAHDDREDGLSSILQLLIQQLSKTFGAFLLLEVWIVDEDNKDDFTIYINHRSAEPVAKKLKDELQDTIGHIQLSSVMEHTDKIGPSYFDTLLLRSEAKQLGCQLVGLAIKPMYMDLDTGRPYPLFTRELRTLFGKALKKGFFEFVRLHTSFNANSFEMLGTTVVEELVWDIDNQLAKCCRLFDFLLLMTPVNNDDAWEDFRKSKYKRSPVFHYRHMPIDPELVKREIYNLPIEDIADPTIAFLFRDKRKEVDRMLSMMIDREKPDFIQTSVQLFGRIDEYLLEVARGILVATPKGEKEKKDLMGAREFAALAEAELDYLKRQHPAIDADIKIRKDVEGVLVTEGNLCLNEHFTVERRRAKALIQHEVGTHIVTYYNGKAQPLKLFCIGVPGYEQLQEGIAVLSEFITGGLTNSRLRVLAARVVAVYEMISGHSFIDTFYLLVDKYGFVPKTAYTITMRVYRGGGLTKDAVYLKGLLNLLTYLEEGHAIAPLLTGKIRQDYLPIVEELVYRKVLHPNPITPRYLQEDYEREIEKIKSGITVFNMIQ